MYEGMICMDFDRIVAGVEPGGLNEVYEIKILICYLLHSVDEELTKNQLNTIFQTDGMVNYFGFSTALAELVESKHVTAHKVNGEEQYTLNKLGAETAEKLKNSLPRSIRERVVAAAMNLQARLKKERETDAHIRRVEDGFVVDCTIRDIGTDLLQMSVYAPDELQAEEIRRRFLAHTTDVYKGLIAFLTQDRQGILEVADTCTDEWQSENKA